jgi:hypothetical protein
MASENDWKCERIFEDADDGLIQFSYEFLTQAEAAARWTIEPLPEGGCSDGSDNRGSVDLGNID